MGRKDNEETADVMPKKLQACGIAGNLYELLCNYLQNRKQYTIVNGSKSECEIVEYGAPQGSLPGPRLFSTTAIDLPDISEGFASDMFADDTTSYCTENSVDSVLSKLQSMINDLSTWSKKNCLTIHPGKSEILVFRLDPSLDQCKEYY